jgi:hypothetical protein
VAHTATEGGEEHFSSFSSWPRSKLLAHANPQHVATGVPHSRPWFW